MPDTLTPEYVRQKLQEIIEDDEITVKDKLAALRMAGDHLKMFESTKRSMIDIRGLFAQLNMDQLKGLTDGKANRHTGKRALPVPTIEMEISSGGDYVSTDNEHDAGEPGGAASENG